MNWKALGMSIIAFIIIVGLFIFMVIAPIMFLQGVACLCLGLFFFGMMKVIYLNFKVYFEKRERGDK